MQFPKSPHADGWHAHMPDQRLLPTMHMVTHDSGDDASSHVHRGLHVLGIVVVALGALAASAGLDVSDDSPLDVRVSTAMHRTGDTLKQWQAQLSHGLQVSLRAVADGSEAAPATTTAKADAPTLVAQANPASTDNGDDRQQPVRADLAPRRPQR